MTTRARSDGVRRFGLIVSTGRGRASGEVAEAFRRWLVHAKGLAGSAILAAVEADVAWRTRGASREEILATASELAGLSRGQGGELLALFAGDLEARGERGRGPAEEVVLSSDGEPVALGELQRRAALAQGGGTQLWLVDADRRPPEQASAPRAGERAVPPGATATVHTIFSEASGAWSLVDTQFSEVRVRLARADGGERELASHAFVTLNFLWSLLRDRGEGEGISVLVRPRSTAQAVAFRAPPCLRVPALAVPAPAVPFRPEDRGLSRPG